MCVCVCVCAQDELRTAREKVVSSAGVPGGGRGLPPHMNGWGGGHTHMGPSGYGYTQSKRVDVTEADVAKVGQKHTHTHTYARTHIGTSAHADMCTRAVFSAIAHTNIQEHAFSAAV